MNTPHPSMKLNARRAKVQGFTLIEILVGIMILGLLMTVLTYTLTGSLRLNQQSQGEINQSSAAQDILEKIRNVWNEPDHTRYDRACAPLSLPAGFTARVINLNSRAQPITPGDPGIDVRLNPAGSVIDCATVPVYVDSTGKVPRMRRLVVSNGPLPRDITLTLDVMR